MKGVFYIVGPTAAGKSALAVEVARNCRGEIVSADAFQIYAGLDLLTAKPEPQLLHTVRHHLIGTTRLTQETDAEQFRLAALDVIKSIQARGKFSFVVGGSGLYVNAVAHGLSALPRGNSSLRAQLNQLTARELLVRLRQLDPKSAATIDFRNKRRLIRAVEICLLTGQTASAQRIPWRGGDEPAGVFVFRDREDLHERIQNRVRTMFENGVLNEVEAAGEVGLTAAQALGLRQIRELLKGRVSEAECIASIQQATRRYAKRQLTWFRRQSTFEPLNLSRHDSSEAIEWISRKARLSFAQQDD